MGTKFVLDVAFALLWDQAAAQDQMAAFSGDDTESAIDRLRELETPQVVPEEEPDDLFALYDFVNRVNARMGGR